MITALLLTAAMAASDAPTASVKIVALSEPGPGRKVQGPWGIFNRIYADERMEAFLSRPKLQPDWYVSRSDKLVISLGGEALMQRQERPFVRGELWLTPRGAIQPPVRARPDHAPLLIKIHSPPLGQAPAWPETPQGLPQRLDWRRVLSECAAADAVCRKPLTQGTALRAQLLRVSGTLELAAEPRASRMLLLLEGSLQASSLSGGGSATADAALIISPGSAVRLNGAGPAVFIEVRADPQ